MIWLMVEVFNYTFVLRRGLGELFTSTTPPRDNSLTESTRRLTAPGQAAS
jgi:hypothetical protein